MGGDPVEPPPLGDEKEAGPIARARLTINPRGKVYLSNTFLTSPTFFCALPSA